MAHIMISCGEASGDLYAGALVEALRRAEPDVRVFGFGGEKLAAAGADLVGDYRGHTVTGLVEVIKHLPGTYRLYRQLVAVARERRPDVFVAIDFPDFNFKLGQAIHALGIPVVYYISPQLWAWRPGRLRTMKAFVDRVLPIFPFEEKVYRDAGIPVEFVGHPLIDLATATDDRATFLQGLGLKADAPTVALLPGSRPNELREILPDLIAAARLVRRDVPGAQFVLARAPNLADDLLEPATRAASAASGASKADAPALPLAIVEGRADDVLAASDVVLTASGTATVQTALHERPMVIVYRLSKLTYAVGRPFVKIDTFGMVNLVAERKIAPELIQDDFTPESAAREIVTLLTDERARTRMIEAIREVKLKLGGPGASRRAADAILREVHARAEVHPHPKPLSQGRGA
jgi:lipid-A-disaccharide synthase